MEKPHRSSASSNSGQVSQLEKVASHLAVSYVLPVVSGVPGVKQAVGFREKGVQKGSMAAKAQAYQKDVKAGSTFSQMQSAAATKAGNSGRSQGIASHSGSGKRSGGSQPGGRSQHSSFAKTSSKRGNARKK